MSWSILVVLVYNKGSPLSSIFSKRTTKQVALQARVIGGLGRLWVYAVDTKPSVSAPPADTELTNLSLVYIGGQPQLFFFFFFCVETYNLATLKLRF